MSENLKCYWPVFSIVNSEGVTTEITAKDSIDPIDRNELKNYSICCSKPPKDIDNVDSEKIKNFLKRECEKIDDSVDNDPSVSKILLIILANLTNSVVQIGLPARSQIPFSKDIKRLFLDNFDKIKINKITFREATVNSVKYCRCSAEVYVPSNEPFVIQMQTLLCDGPPIEEEDLPFSDDPTPPTEPPKKQTPKKDIFLGSVDYSNDCHASNKSHIRSEIQANVFYFLKPELDVDGKKNEDALSYYLKGPPPKTSLWANKLKRSPSVPGSTNIRELVTSSLVKNCTLATVDTYSILDNTQLVSNEPISQSSNYSQYMKFISLRIIEERNYTYGFIPKSLNFTFYNQQQYEKNLAEVGVFLYSGISQNGRNNKNECYVLNPYRGGIRVPIILEIKFKLILNFNKITIPFFIKAGINSDTLQPCEREQGVKEITLTRDNGEINNNFYIGKFSLTTTVYVDYVPGRRKEDIEIEKIPDKNNLEIFYSNNLGSGKAICNIQFKPGTEDLTISLFANPLDQPYSIFSDEENNKYLIFKNNLTKEALVNLIKEPGRFQMLPASRAVVNNPQPNEIAGLDNVDKWVSSNIKPPVLYYKKIVYNLLDSENGAAYATENNTVINSYAPDDLLSDVSKLKKITIKDQIIHNLNSPERINISFERLISNDRQSILTQKGLNSIKEILESPTPVKKTECCCYEWAIGTVNPDGSENRTIPWSRTVDGVTKKYVEAERTFELYE